MDDKAVLSLSTYYCFFLENEGTFYYVNTDYNLALVYQNEEWVECNCEEVRHYHSAKPDRVAENINVSPKEAMKALVKKKEDEVKEYWEDLISKVAPHVIGYINTSYGTYNFAPMQAGDLTDEQYASIIKDYREKGYFYSGEDYQESGYPNTPILDNYRYVDFSRRGFGAMMALVAGDYNRMAYARYTENYGFEADTIYPEGGIYPHLKRGPLDIEVNENTLTSLEQETLCPEERFVLIQIDNENGFYWYDDVITLHYQDKTIKGNVSILAQFSDEEEFKDYLDRYAIEVINEYTFIPHKTMLFLAPYYED